ncbi:MAG: hypothetical protein RL213_843 [Bacteroidota bacterium]
MLNATNASYILNKITYDSISTFRPTMKNLSHFFPFPKCSPLAFLCISLLSFGASGSNNLLDPATQPRFVNRLTVPQILDARSGGTFTVPVTQFQQNLGLKNPSTQDSMLTTVWGYGGMSPGPTIITRQGTPSDFYFHNELRNGTTPLPHLLEIDTTIHWAFSGDTTLIRQYGVPISTHLHGGKTESASDGLPDSWYTPGYGLIGMDCELSNTVPYHYTNDQEAATNWYHDHTLGITRLNVYTGLYGAYLLRDNTEENLIATNQLPSDSFQIPLILQDRMFTDDGQLYYPSENDIVPGIPSVLPEFYGNIMMVNDKAWPYLEVEPRPYRFRLINASDSRF